MRSLLTVIGCFATFWARGVSYAIHNETEGLIVGGKFAEPGEYPFVVEFITVDNNGGRYLCGGSIVNKQWILTAAHCLEKTPVYVTVGQYDRSTTSPNAVRHAIAFGVVHRLFGTISTYNDDIAMLKLQKEIQFNEFVKPASFPNGDINYAGKTGTIIGWGYIDTQGPDSTILRKLQVVIEGYEQCDRTYTANRISGGPYPYEVCVDSNIGQGACGGDSGGPLIVREADRNIVIGLTSRGLTTCGTEIPEIYVLVYKFRSWINNVLQTYKYTVSNGVGRPPVVRY